MTPARDAIKLGTRLGRAVSGAAAEAAGRTALAGLDALLGWRYTDEAVRRVLASPATDRAIGHALQGPLVEAVARDLARYAVLERVADEVLEVEAAERIVDRMLAEGIAERLADRLLESEELWLVVDEIASSPAVTEAIAHQSVGFADQVAGRVRLQSQHADAGLERVARRLLRRKPAPSAGPDPR